MSSIFDLRSVELLQDSSLSLAFKRLITTSHKFLMNAGISDTFCQFGDQLICNNLFRLPFDEVLFEFASTKQHDRVSRISLIAAQYRTKIIVVPFIRYHDRSWSGGTDFRLYLDTEKALWENAPAYHTTQDEDWNEHQWFVADVFAASVAMIGSQKYSIIDVDIPDRLTKIREKRNRPPVFAHKIVEIPNEARERIDLGGTHSSPALHWRRGHFRQLPDRVVPVSPCLVGSLEHGMVVKDYDARETR